MAMHSAPSNPSQKASVLNSWKEIARYLGCGVRTVQRYEKDSISLSGAYQESIVGL